VLDVCVGASYRVNHGLVLGLDRVTRLFWAGFLELAAALVLLHTVCLTFFVRSQVSLAWQWQALIEGLPADQLPENGFQGFRGDLPFAPRLFGWLSYLFIYFCSFLFSIFFIFFAGYSFYV
jgi:hypothetical protein